MISSPAYDLAHAGDTDGIRNWLRDHSEDLNAYVSDGYALLHVACLFGHESLVALLLGRGALVNLNADNASRAAPLHCAVMFRDEAMAARIAQMLIDNGAELNGKQKGGQTALHHAVARGSVGLTEMLVQAGADPFIKDDQKRSPMDLARTLPLENNQEIQEALKQAHSLPLEG